MQNIILPLNLDPPIKGYQHHAYKLGVLLAEDDKYMNFLYNRYIQLQYIPKNTCGFNFYCGVWEFPFFFFESEYIQMSTLAALKVSVLDYIWEKLSMGYYVLCDFDEYYVRGKKSYMKMHFIHDTLIYGSENGCFILAGYDESNHYGVQKIANEDFEKAFWSDYDEKKKDRRGRIIAFKRKPRTEDININLISSLLYDYINSCNTATRNYFYDISGENNLFGLAACKKLKESIYEKIDVRFFHIFWEHKDLMQKRVRHLINLGYIKEYRDEAYREIVHKALILRNIAIKLHIRDSEKEKERAVNLIESINNSEKEILECVLHDIYMK